MQKIVKKLGHEFDRMQDRMRVFCEQGVQVEGWFKGEFLYCLNLLAEEGSISSFDRERKGPSGVTDIYIEENGKCHWGELKHWLIGKQKGKEYGPSFYFGHNNYAYKDVEKLNAINKPDKRWLLILCTASPDQGSWSNSIEKFNERFSPFWLSSQASPPSVVGSYYLGLLEVGQA